MELSSNSYLIFFWSMCTVINILLKYDLNNLQQGEGVPEQRRSQCARHFEDIKRFVGVSSLLILLIVSVLITSCGAIALQPFVSAL